MLRACLVLVLVAWAPGVGAWAASPQLKGTRAGRALPVRTAAEEATAPAEEHEARLRRAQAAVNAAKADPPSAEDGYAKAKETLDKVEKLKKQKLSAMRGNFKGKLTNK